MKNVCRAWCHEDLEFPLLIWLIGFRFLRPLLQIHYCMFSIFRAWITRAAKTSMSMCFRNNFGCKFNAIIDCFELFIDRLTNLIACNLTWLNYSHIVISHNTGKCVIGVTHQGTIDFISKGLGERQFNTTILTFLLSGNLQNIKEHQKTSWDCNSCFTHSVYMKQKGKVNLNLPLL